MDTGGHEYWISPPDLFISRYYMLLITRGYCLKYSLTIEVANEDSLTRFGKWAKSSSSMAEKRVRNQNSCYHMMDWRASRHFLFLIFFNFFIFLISFLILFVKFIYIHTYK